MKPGLIAYFAGNPVAANLFMLFLIIGGAISGAHLAVQHAAEIDLRTVTVGVKFHGATPREIEEDINRRIEESVVGLPGVARVVATAVQGAGSVRIEMAAFADPDTDFDDVQNAVDEIENFPPPGADRPEVSLDRVSLEVMTLAVTSSAVTENALRLAAEDLRDTLLELPSVTQVSLVGTRDREIAIALSEEELRRHHRSFAEITSALRRASVNLTTGELRTEAGGVVLQIIAKRRTGDDFKDIPLITRLDGSIPTLGEVAAISDGLADQDVIATVNGTPAIFVRVDAAEQQSIVDMAADIEEKLAGYEAPPGVAVSVWNDRAAPTLARLAEIVRNAVIGAVLVFLCLVEEFGGTAIHTVSVIVGATAPTRLRSEESRIDSHVASVRAHLVDTPPRTATIGEIEQAWRRQIGDQSYLEEVEFQTTRIHVKPDVAYALEHDDTQTLREAVRDLRGFLETVPGVYQISDSLSLGKRHFEVELTPAGKAAGLTLASLGAQLRSNFHGAVVQRVQRGREEIKVMVRYPTERRRSLRELSTERIRRPGGGEVPLSAVVRLTEPRELANRLRIDGRQAALVEARADAATITPLQARRNVEREFMPGLIAQYPGLRIDDHGAARNEREVRETLRVLVPLVLIAMYALMAGFLRSYWKPLVAVAGIPIAFAGAVFSHWILGGDLTVVSIFGVIAVAGVVVNDGLVLLDRYNAIRREGEAIPAIAAASAAARNRFRAVFLTSLTTVLGLSPLLYERSEELRFLVPFVVSMLGGLVLASIFTLFFLPALVMIVDGRRE